MNKIGRNDKCPCGSGLKYKNCCLDKEIINPDDLEEIGNDSIQKATISILKSSINSNRIALEDGNGFYRIFWDDNIEKVNPIEYYKQFELKRRAITYRDILEIKNPFFASKLTIDFFVRYADKTLKDERFWEVIEQTEVNENFLKLFKTTRKKDQEFLLKGLSINPNQLISLIFKSFKDFGYLYSKYRYEILPKGLESKKRPKIADISEVGNIKIIGETDLTQGQVKNIFEQRKVIIAHLFDKEDNWHCLFITYNSIGGKENWKDGQAHFHYISSAFGISREDFIESMRNGQYLATSIHIDLLGYGNQSLTS